MKNSIDQKLQNRQYRSMVLEVRKEEEKEQEQDYTVTGYATTFNQAYTLWDDGEWRLDEIVSSKAFENCDMSDVIMQYDHQGKVFARTRNNTLELEVDENGLLVTAYLGGTEIGRNLYEEIKGGYIDRMSFGFIVSGDEMETETIDGKEVTTRTITNISKLFDVSAVSFPANDFTQISARNCFNGAKEAIEAERLEEQRRKLKLKAKQKLMGV